MSLIHVTDAILFFFNVTATTEIYTLSLHDALPISWYFKTYWLVIAFLGVGPLALPLLWVNPRFSWKKKTVISIIVIGLSYYLTVITMQAVKNITDYYQQIVPLF